MATLAVSLCALLFATVEGQSCGQNRAYPQGRTLSRIINGQKANECSAPWQVQIYFIANRRIDTASRLASDWRNTFRCGGTIVDASHVYVSPSCIYLNYPTHDEALRQMVVVAGDYDLSLVSGREQIRYPQELYFPSYYPIRNQQQMRDGLNFTAQDFSVLREGQCGIVKLDRPFNFDNCVGQICLPTVGQSANCLSESCLMLGNGFVSGTLSVERPPYVQITRMTALPKTVCEILEAENYALSGTTDTICAESDTNGLPCLMDNGGALACWDDANKYWYMRGASVMDNCDESQASIFADMIGPCSAFMRDVMAGREMPLAIAV